MSTMWLVSLHYAKLLPNKFLVLTRNQLSRRGPFVYVRIWRTIAHHVLHQLTKSTFDSNNMTSTNAPTHPLLFALHFVVKLG